MDNKNWHCHSQNNKGEDKNGDRETNVQSTAVAWQRMGVGRCVYVYRIETTVTELTLITCMSCLVWSISIWGYPYRMCAQAIQTDRQTPWLLYTWASIILHRERGAVLYCNASWLGYNSQVPLPGIQNGVCSSLNFLVGSIHPANPFYLESR